MSVLFIYGLTALLVLSVATVETLEISPFAILLLEEAIRSGDIHIEAVLSPAEASASRAVPRRCAAWRRIADLQGLQHCRKILAGVEHRIRVTQLRHDLVGAVLLPSPRHRKSPCPLGKRPSYRLDQDFQGRPRAPPCVRFGPTGRLYVVWEFNTTVQNCGDDARKLSQFLPARQRSRCRLG